MTSFKIIGRRDFLQSVGAGAVGLALTHNSSASDKNSLGPDGTYRLPFGGIVAPPIPGSKKRELVITSDQDDVVVSGATFSYTISKRNGLITSMSVLGEELTASPVPDLTIAQQLNRAISPYRASGESHASFSVVSSASDRVVISAEGSYTSSDGQQFPVRYSITYEITVDGVVLARVSNRAVRDCSFRWLTLSSGAVRSSLTKFLSWMSDQAFSQTSSYVFRSLGDAPADSSRSGNLLSGVFLPWFWIGNERIGLEVTTPDVDSQTYNVVDGSWQTDESDMFVVRQEASAVHWENFLVRGTYTQATAGWQRSGEFAFAITPSKTFDPYYAMLKVGHVGPHQYAPEFRQPDEQQILTLAQNGYDLLVGLANWRSGEYMPRNENELRRTLALCHQYGVKVIPYVTLMDLSEATDTFRQHGEEWAIQPTVEHFRQSGRFRDVEVEMAYRNAPGQQTTLMCPGAPGWRTHWKKQIDRIVHSYDFDGLYIDFWFGRMVCENRHHGCGTRFRKFTIMGAREMMSYAHDAMKAKNPHAVFIVNTNLLSTALLTSLVDVRLVGEGGNMATMGIPSREWLYNSYRLGEPTQFLWANTPWNPAERSAFAALVNFLPDYYQRPLLSPRKMFDDFDVFRYFGAETGAWHLGIEQQRVLQVAPASVIANVIEKRDRILTTLINTESSPVTAKVSVEAGRIAYDPLMPELFKPRAGTIAVALEGNTHRSLVLRTLSAHPQILFVLGVRKMETEEWVPRSRTLRFSPRAVAGSSMQITLHSKQRPREITSRSGRQIAFEWSPQTFLTQIHYKYEAGDTLVARF